jgi:hypothetical protein
MMDAYAIIRMLSRRVSSKNSVELYAMREVIWESII